MIKSIIIILSVIMGVGFMSQSPAISAEQSVNIPFTITLTAPTCRFDQLSPAFYFEDVHVSVMKNTMIGNANWLRIPASIKCDQNVLAVNIKISGTGIGNNTPGNRNVFANVGGTAKEVGLIFKMANIGDVPLWDERPYRVSMNNGYGDPELYTALLGMTKADITAGSFFAPITFGIEYD